MDSTDIKETENLSINSQEFKVDTLSFNGSFELLVSLIREKKMDIMTIDLNVIAKQYVNFVNDNISSIKIDDLTEYLLLATYLLELKSKRALPVIESQQQAEKETERDKFIQKLVLQKQYKTIVEELENKYEQRSMMFDKEKYDFDEYFENEQTSANVLPESLDITKILKAIQKTYLRLENKKNNKKDMPTKIDINEISIDMVQDEIKEFLNPYDFNSRITLDEYIANIPEEKFSRQYFVVAFVAILVLVKESYILIEQDELNSQIYIIKNKVEEVINEY